ncbi:hypothetical protein L6452_00461 [Arctium lappa]|uniref:Uncharacterized protein n=1 Tax=Arctium lappa TaxID=4217 RepID=A0ACB9FES7_ARCLA|nr:hypothetical protein L6452_00461 [Arctium lappa]
MARNFIRSKQQRRIYSDSYRPAKARAIFAGTCTTESNKSTVDGGIKLKPQTRKKMENRKRKASKKMAGNDESVGKGNR